MFLNKFFILLLNSLYFCHIFVMAKCKVDIINDLILELGEGPHWDIETQSLYFVDILGGSIHRYDYNEDQVYSCKVENEPLVSFIIPIEGKKDEYAIGIGRRVGIIQWDGRENLTKVNRIEFEVENDDKEKYEFNRFNDAKADPKGRFFGGTMKIETKNLNEMRTGNFYSYGGDGDDKKLKKFKESVGISNGMAWNETTNKMYYIDSWDYNVVEYDYNPDTGDISNPKVLIDFRVNGKKPNFAPDGMTIDNKGFLYVATWGGSKVLKINPTNGKVEQEFLLPAEQITSCAFGGPNLDILYVTSAARNNKAEPAGRTFQITGHGAVGLKMHKLKL